MATVLEHPQAAGPPPTGRKRFANFAEYWQSIGSIPLKRILLDAPFSLAMESDVLWLIAEHKQYCELIDGTLVEKAVGSFEDLIATMLLTSLNAFVQARKLGIATGSACIIRVSPDQLRMPDVSFFSNERIPNRSALTDPIWDMVPDLAVEIISVGNTRDEMARKIREYFAAGVREIWFIYPKTRTAEVFQPVSPEPVAMLQSSDRLDGGSIIPGFGIVINDLFAPIDQK